MRPFYRLLYRSIIIVQTLIILYLLPPGEKVVSNEGCQSICSLGFPYMPGSSGLSISLGRGWSYGGFYLPWYSPYSWVQNGQMTLFTPGTLLYDCILPFQGFAIAKSY